MKKKDLNAFMSDYQTEWRAKNLNIRGNGKHNGKSYPWILPHQNWEEGLWAGVRTPLSSYLSQRTIKVHSGVNNLKSSWILCANLYFPFCQDLDLLKRFFVEELSLPIMEVLEVELEYAADPPLDPATLLGESKGIRGQNQTSPDIAFIVKTTKGRRGIILNENKFTEDHFYRCSGRDNKYGNPDTKRCMNFRKVLGHPEEECFQMQWNRPKRRYWDWLKPRFNDEARGIFKCCPAAKHGYQLFRQQALGEALAKMADYDLVVSSVSYDRRNDKLVSSLAKTGIGHFSEWGKMFSGKVIFKTFTHQQWIQFIEKQNDRSWDSWLHYVKNRYQFDIIR
jgi:hypothetical protein